MTFLKNTKAEFLKIKGTSAWWLTLLAAAFLPAINTVILLERPDVFTAKFKDYPWLALLHMNWKNAAALILPVYVILLNNVLAQIEFRNNTWKQVYATPRSYADIFFSKFLVMHLLLILFFIFFNLFVLLSGYLITTLNDGYPFSSHAIAWKQLLQLSVRIYIAVLTICAVQFWLSVRFKNFIVPIRVGIGLLITGLVLMDWEKIIYYPYMYPTLLFFIDAPTHKGSLPQLLSYSIIFFAVVLILGFLNVYRLTERG